MNQIEVSPGGIGFIRTAPVDVPGVPDAARRQRWITGDEAPIKVSTEGDVASTRRDTRSDE